MRFEITDESLSYSITVAAERVGVSTKTLSRAIDRGDLIARYVGRKPLIERDELQAWLRSLPTEPSRRTVPAYGDDD